jgi:hypothetical protein
LKQDYFIVVLAHSFHGRLRRLHVPHRFLYGTFGVLGFALLCLFGVAGSYARMALKVSNYNSLQRETELLRHRYDTLQKQVQQTNQQLASLQVLATEVSAAYGIRNQIAGSPDLIGEAPLIPSMGDSLAEYNYLRTTNLTRRSRTIFSRADVNVLPGTWPVVGPLMAGFGQRMDPFSGESAHHSGRYRSSLRYPGQSRCRWRRDFRRLERWLRPLCDSRSRQWLPDVVWASFENRRDGRRRNSPG